MVLEIAQFSIAPGHEDDFAAGYRSARPLIAGSEGCRSVRMTHGIESPSRFVLLVEWDSVEAHEKFRASEKYPRWRAHISPHFADAPHVEHYSDVR